MCNDKDYCVLTVYGLTCPTYPRSTFTQFFCLRKLCLRQNALYLGGHSAQPYIPHQSSHTKGMCVSVIAWLIVRQKLCHLSCTLVISIPPKIPLLEFRGQFWGLAEPPLRNSAISHGCTLQHTHMSFQTWSKSVQDKCPKGRIVLVTEKTTPFGTIWQDPPKICECALWSHTYIPGFIPVHSGLGSYNWEALPRPPKWIWYWLLWAYN